MARMELSVVLVFLVVASNGLPLPSTKQLLAPSNPWSLPVRDPCLMAVIVDLADCGDYVHLQSNLTNPTEKCCNSVKSFSIDVPQCACFLVKAKPEDFPSPSTGRGPPSSSVPAMLRTDASRTGTRHLVAVTPGALSPSAQIFRSSHMTLSRGSRHE
ncbi:unnamed protein product [Spirodela intermedia]|uniref:Bifunctional inhibitor/plant lipid transfer protein/seed storage helical domain-containing protein n=1 Tax=Spirodela intermedia TaxID=51605 RepID=A0ABN7ED07_SPIIN|nr:unnamed protein product [Spirodela intermedia]